MCVLHPCGHDHHMLTCMHITSPFSSLAEESARREAERAKREQEQRDVAAKQRLAEEVKRRIAQAPNVTVSLSMCVCVMLLMVHVISHHMSSFSFHCDVMCVFHRLKLLKPSKVH